MKPRIVFLGTPEFALDSLDILLQYHYDIALVVTAPDQPAGRGRHLQASPVKRLALEKKLAVAQPVKLKDPGFLLQLQETRADLFIVVAFRMLPEVVWAMPRLGTFNLHASLLPNYRGAAPINHAIMNGDKETGLTTFFLKQEIDTGEILFQEKLAIGPDETAGELHDRMKTAGAELVLKTVRAIESGNISPSRQEDLIKPGEALLTAPKIFKDDCRLDWSRKVEDIFNKVRGLSPSPAAYTYLLPPGGEPQMIKIYRGHISRDNLDLLPGSIVTDQKQTLGITAIGGTFYIDEVQLAGKRIMKTTEFLNGFKPGNGWMAGETSP